MKLVSIDVGIKNLAFCLMEKHNDSFRILQWDVITLCEDEKYKCGKLINGDICGKDAKYKRNNDYFCKRHAAKEDYAIPTAKDDITKIKKLKLNLLYAYADEHQIEYHKPITKASLITIVTNHIEKTFFQPVKIQRADTINLITLGRNLKSKFDTIFSSDFIDITHVAIENQISPIANRMKTLQGMIAQYFIMKTNAEIYFISSSNKLKHLEPSQEKNTYQTRKRKGISECREFLENKYETWGSHFEKHSKKDDLADAFLQALYVIRTQL